MTWESLTDDDLAHPDKATHLKKQAELCGAAVVDAMGYNKTDDGLRFIITVFEDDGRWYVHEVFWLKGAKEPTKVVARWNQVEGASR